MLLLLAAITIHAQQSALTPVFTAPDSGLVLDFRYGKVLTVKQTGGTFTYRLTDVSTGTAAVIPFNQNYQLPAFVTPYGALIQAQGTVSPLYEYNQGTFTMLSSVASNVSTAGDYVVWYSQDAANRGLILRNMGTGQQQVVVDSTITGAGVAANGMVAYATGRFLYRYLNGVTTFIDEYETENPNRDPPAYFYGIQTDGERISYQRTADEDGTKVYLFDHDSVTQVLLQGDYGGYTDFPLQPPLLNNGYLGGIYLAVPYFYHVDGQVYTRDRQGNLRYVLPIKTGSTVGTASVAAISPMGDIAVTGRSGINYFTYIISQDGSFVKKVADKSLQAYYEDSTWFLSDAQYLFSVDLDTAQNHYIVPFTKQVYTRSRLPFTASDFTQHYIGPDSGIGRLEQIQITATPKHGVMTISGTPIWVDNTYINRNLLDQLKYSAPSFPGRDTIRWRAFDGTKWTNDTSLYIDILPAPDTIKPFDRNTLAGTPIRFWAANFKLNFTGKLAGIRVSSLPAYGKLTIGGKQLVYERSRDVTLAELDSMYYTPNPNIVGVDTLQWMAFNGTEYTKNDTPAILHVYPILTTPPILRTLESSYSITGAPDTILIANYPLPRWHTDVIVLLDNSQQLPVAADHTFIIDPSAYSAGNHQLKVTFKHRLDSISILRSFTITGAALSPLMVSAEYGIGVTQELTLLSVSPNPFSGQLILNGLDWNKTYILRLFDAQGRLVRTDRSFNQSKKVLELSNNTLTKGVYFLEVYDVNSNTVVKTIKLLHL